MYWKAQSLNYMLRASPMRFAKRPANGSCRKCLGFLSPTWPPRLMSFSLLTPTSSLYRHFTSLALSSRSPRSNKTTNPRLSCCAWNSSLSLLVELKFKNPSLAESRSQVPSKWILVVHSRHLEARGKANTICRLEGPVCGHHKWCS